MRRLHPLTLGVESSAMRRRLGPTAWAVLEAFACRTNDDAATADASVRDVADEVGIAKNTAHRAVQRLVAAGLVSLDQRRQADGRFLTGRYLLTIPPEVLQLAPNDVRDANEPNARPAVRGPRSRDVMGTQLDLLADGY